MLRASDHYNRKGLVFYILLFYNQYVYGDLSIFLFFVLLRFTPAEVHLLILYFYLCHTRYIFNHNITLLLLKNWTQLCCDISETIFDADK